MAHSTVHIKWLESETPCSLPNSDEVEFRETAEISIQSLNLRYRYMQGKMETAIAYRSITLTVSSTVSS